MGSSYFVVQEYCFLLSREEREREEQASPLLARLRLDIQQAWGTNSSNNKQTSNETF